MRPLAALLSALYVALAGCAGPGSDRPPATTSVLAGSAQVAFPARMFAPSRGLDGRLLPARADVVSRDFFVRDEDYRMDFGYYAYLVLRDRPSADTAAATLEATRAFFCETEEAGATSLDLVPAARSVVLFAPLAPGVDRQRFAENRDLARFLDDGYDFVISRLWWNALNSRIAATNGTTLPPILIAAAETPLFHQTRSPATLIPSEDTKISFVDLSGDSRKVRDTVRRFRNRLVLPAHAADDGGGFLGAVRLVIADLAEVVDPILTMTTRPERPDPSGSCYL